MSSNQLTRTQQSISRSTSLRDRIARDRSSGSGTILLLDISGSMHENSDFYDCNSQPKIAILWQIVQQLRSENHQFKIATFNTEAQWSDLVTCPIPEGGTALCQALEFISKPTKPSTITLITDGLPFDPQPSLDYARKLDCRINVLYVGPSNAHVAIGFCSTLARITGGSFSANSISSEMLQIEAAKQIAGFIEAPASERKTINL